MAAPGLRGSDGAVALPQRSAGALRDLVTSGHRGAPTVLFLGLAALLLPLLWTPEGYRGSSDLHVAMEIVGGTVGLIGGLAFMARYVGLGDGRLFVVGLAFLGNGAISIVHGWLPFAFSRGWLTTSADVLARVVPATYSAGQLLMAVLLIRAASAPAPTETSERGSPRIAAIASLTTIAIGAAITWLLFLLPVPAIVLPTSSVPRPVDIATGVAAASAAVLLWRAAATGDAGARWAAVSAVFLTASEFAIGFSDQLFDARFDLAHVYKIAAFAVPLLALSVNQVRLVAAGQQRALELSTSARIRDEFVAAVSHELRTPLALIDGHASLAAESADGAEVRRHLETVREQARALARHVDDLIALSEPASPVVAHRSDLREVAAALGLAVVTWTGDVAVAAPEDHVERILRGLLDGREAATIEIRHDGVAVTARLGAGGDASADPGPTPFGVAIAARLAADLGGAVWLEPGEDGSDDVLLRLPAATA